MNRPVHPYIAFSSLAIVALIVGVLIWSGNNQLSPSTTASPSPQPSTEAGWTHYVNKKIGFQMDIPTRTANIECSNTGCKIKSIISLKFSDKNGDISIYEENSVDQKGIIDTSHTGYVYTNIWVGKATNFEQLQQFYQKVAGGSGCQLLKESWPVKYPIYKDINDGYNILGNGCAYNGLIYFKKAGIAVYHTLPLKTAQTFFNPLNASDQSYDNKFISSIKPIAQ